MYSSLQVRQELHQKSTKRGPDEQELSKLSKDVEEFAVRLVDPLKSDDGNRDVFGAEINYFADQAIERGQKKSKIRNWNGN